MVCVAHVCMKGCDDLTGKMVAVGATSLRANAVMAGHELVHVWGMWCV